ncbi:DUF4105 domain-containing protein [Mannheimia sp. AT1]|uniref:DUF4105 domain-containing protein n=1 Tax=Mannheimia cairinae TaxID=3025936 RepID=A0ABT5MNK6_9PAST|nr:DUF4105 domain-containing protein [Mannheimia cairinae]MDD0823685.1 DUF4105 domain-containing protein [Mannheimia cairinae]MDD0825383.1 DUF4105 domain-containing protein [Mannheimia cairinae]
MKRKFFYWLIQVTCGVFVVASNIWLSLALWVHKPLGNIMTSLIIISWCLLTCSLIGFYIKRVIFSRKTDIFIYTSCLSIGLLWFFSMEAKNDRNWDLEVAKVMTYQQDGNTIRLDNVRNFHWRNLRDYDVIWESRYYDLDKIESFDLILSDWGLKKIVHTMVSFGFSNGKRISFSIEIRKEENERFSAIGGFFRQFELGFVAGDELDLLYTRTNIRGEDVYIYPVKLSKKAMQELFLLYIEKGQKLSENPSWYNTLMSNCTTLIFDMMAKIEAIPLDYRGVMSGLLPEYLYDKEVLDNKYSLSQWRDMAHANPKVVGFTNLSEEANATYSQLIRKGFPSSSQ